jgi:hypothetical protein
MVRPGTGECGAGADDGESGHDRALHRSLFELVNSEFPHSIRHAAPPEEIPDTELS